MNILRSTLFALWALLWTLLTAPLVIGGPLLLRGLWGYHFGKLWRLGIQWGVEHLLGIRPRVIGLENMPQEACVILSKHQSAWDTIVFFALCDELGILLAGPNGQGVISTPSSLCAQIVAPYPPAGRISVVSQSGNFVSSFENYAKASGVGIARAVAVERVGPQRLRAGPRRRRRGTPQERDVARVQHVKAAVGEDHGGLALRTGTTSPHSGSRTPPHLCRCFLRPLRRAEIRHPGRYKPSRSSAGHGLIGSQVHRP